jgi:predicted amidophosphoribosyltransferase
MEEGRLRKCLGCGKEFRSSGFANRHCEACVRELNSHANAVILEHQCKLRDRRRSGNKVDWRE